VLLAALALCWVRWQHRGTAVAVGLSLLFVVLFVLSHLLALAIGAWPAVIAVSFVMAAVVWLAADAPRSSRPSRVG
jgi:hypothetical protein